MIAGALIDAGASFAIAPMDSIEGVIMVSVIGRDPEVTVTAIESAREKFVSIFGRDPS